MVRDCKLPHGGHAKFTCLYEKDTVALPRLVEQGKRIQFCFIDGLHTFDYTMLDAFFADQALQPPIAPHPSPLPSWTLNLPHPHLQRTPLQSNDDAVWVTYYNPNGLTLTLP